jgi:hypothetical protein
METIKPGWQPVNVPEGYRAKLMRQILVGTIERADFPELWPTDVYSSHIRLTPAQRDAEIEMLKRKLFQDDEPGR